MTSRRTFLLMARAIDTQTKGNRCTKLVVPSAAVLVERQQIMWAVQRICRTETRGFTVLLNIVEGSGWALPSGSTSQVGSSVSSAVKPCEAPMMVSTAYSHKGKRDSRSSQPLLMSLSIDYIMRHGRACAALPSSPINLCVGNAVCKACSTSASHSLSVSVTKSMAPALTV